MNNKLQVLYLYCCLLSIHQVYCLLPSRQLRLMTPSSLLSVVNGMKSNNQIILYGSKSQPNNKRKAYADDLSIEDDKCRNNVIIDDIHDDNNNADNHKCCYFDKNTPCPLYNICPYDERPCKANRAYFDHIFGNNANTDEANGQSNDIASNDGLSDDNIMQISTSKYLNSKKYLSKKELRVRRKKMFLMSTWLEDLLPDPHQGQDLVLNWTVDMMKIVYRSVLVILSMTTIINKPKFLDFYDNLY